MVSMILIRIHSSERDATLTFLKSYKGVEKRVSFFNRSALWRPNFGTVLFARDLGKLTLIDLN